MDPNDVRSRPIETEAARLEVEHAPPGEIAGPRPGHGSSLRRMIGTLVLAGGLLAVGGASVAMAASPQPSAPTSPSTQGSSGSHGNGTGSTSGGCQHHGRSPSGSGASSSPSSSSGT